MNTYAVTLLIRAECPDDANELLEDYTGQETSIDIIETNPTAYCKTCNDNTIVLYELHDTQYNKCIKCGGSQDDQEEDDNTCAVPTCFNETTTGFYCNLHEQEEQP